MGTHLRFAYSPLGLNAGKPETAEKTLAVNAVLYYNTTYNKSLSTGTEINAFRVGS